MSKSYSSRLDRLFPRLFVRDYRPAARDAWDPSWQPRGRWWMRAQRGQRGADARRAAMWRRLTRPGRAA